MKLDTADKPAIKVEDLSKSFAEVKAVSHVSFSVAKKEIYALIGPNGSGKTTLIKMIIGLLLPDSGESALFGYNIQESQVEAKKIFGYISDNPDAYLYLTGREFLTLTGSLRTIEKETLCQRIKELIKLFPLEDVIDKPMAQYSRGNRQKVAFLAALLPKPKLLIIDEPVVGLDPTSIEIVGKALREFAAEGGTVFFATHTLSFAQNYATKVGVMYEGKLIDEKKISSNVSLEQLYQLSTKS